MMVIDQIIAPWLIVALTLSGISLTWAVAWVVVTVAKIVRQG